ncbi:hypothetical protein BC831DRAFT_451374 [Entophlyctis helioformis]|nr:hypothetical protein BC831DRAFT_451374 [Entophlyctis helioformis]
MANESGDGDATRASLWGRRTGATAAAAAQPAAAAAMAASTASGHLNTQPLPAAPSATNGGGRSKKSAKKKQSQPAQALDFGPRLQDRMTSIEQSGFYKTLVDDIYPLVAAFGGKAGSDKKLDCVCYGIGSIAESKLAQFQFALLLLMIRDLEFGQVHMYEPMMTAAEAEFAVSRGITIIPENENGKRLVANHTLFYMPHCEGFLYSNVLEANWAHTDQIAIMGNSFETYDRHSIGDRLQTTCPFVAKSLAIVTETPMQAFAECETAFNNTSLLRFK